MSKIVCIAEGTYTPGSNEIGDIVSVHEDNVKLGSAYDTFKIITIDLPAETLCEKIYSLIPDVREASRISHTNGWTLENPEVKKVWKNSNAEWCDLIEDPKYQLSVKNLTEENLSDLEKDSVTSTVKESILTGVLEKISINSKNLIKVADLNTLTKLDDLNK